MERVGEHPVPVGPLAVRWLAYELPDVPGGDDRSRARVALRNAGSATWRSRGEAGVQLSYHWLDDRGNAIVWDGPRIASSGRSRPARRSSSAVELRAPQPPGRYRLAFDLVEEFRFWFAEVGSSPLELDVEVPPRIDERRLAVVVHGGSDAETAAALARRRSRSSTRTRSRPRTSSRARRPRRTGRAASSTRTPKASPRSAARSRRATARCAPWAPGGGRNPAFAHPLLLPSLLAGLEPGEHEGLPAYVPQDGEPAIFDGRIRLRLPRGRPRG